MICYTIRIKSGWLVITIYDKKKVREFYIIATKHEIDITYNDEKKVSVKKRLRIREERWNRRKFSIKLVI